MPETDKEIRMRLSLETKNLVTKINEAKQQITQLARETKQSFAVVAEVLKRTFKEDEMTKAINVFGEVTKEKFREITKAATEYNKEMSLALTSLATEEKQITADRKQNAIYEIDAQKQKQEQIKQLAAEEKEIQRQKREQAKQWVDQNKQNAVLEIENQKQIIEAKKVALDAQKEYVASIKNGTSVTSVEAQKQGVYLNKLAERIKQLATTAKLSYQQAGQNLINMGADKGSIQNAISLLNAGKPAAQGFAASLGTVASAALKMFGIFTAYQVLSKFVGLLKDAAQAAYEFTKAAFSLGVAVNVLQRTGIDISIKDVYDNLDRLQQKFGDRKSVV